MTSRQASRPDPVEVQSKGNRPPLGLFDRLPIELQLRIFTYLDPKRRAEDRAALARCLRVFRPLIEALLEHLYQYLALTWLYRKQLLAISEDVPIESLAPLNGYTDKTTWRSFVNEHTSRCQHLVIGGHEPVWVSGHPDDLDFSGVEILHSVYAPHTRRRENFCTFHQNNDTADTCRMCDFIVSLSPKTVLVDVEQLSHIGDIGKLLALSWSHGSVETIVIRPWTVSSPWSASTSMADWEETPPLPLKRIVILFPAEIALGPAQGADAETITKARNHLVTSLSEIMDTMFDEEIPPGLEVLLIGLEGLQRMIDNPTVKGSAQFRLEVEAEIREMALRRFGGAKDRSGVPWTTKLWRHVRFASLAEYAGTLDGVQKDVITRASWRNLQKITEGTGDP